jgi:hypothetical protein
MGVEPGAGEGEQPLAEVFHPPLAAKAQTPQERILIA